MRSISFPKMTNFKSLGLSFALLLAIAMTLGFTSKAQAQSTATISSGTCTSCVYPAPTSLLTLSSTSTIESSAIGVGNFKTVDPTGKGVSTGMAEGYSKELFTVTSTGTLTLDPNCKAECGDQRYSLGFDTMQQVGGLAVGTLKIGGTDGVAGGIEGGAQASTGTAAKGVVTGVITITPAVIQPLPAPAKAP